MSQSLLPAILDLSSDKKWRIRLAIIEHLPALAQQLGVEFFETKLAELCTTWLGDSVASIREAAAMNLSKLSAVFGVPWSLRFLVPRVATLASSPNYLYRITAVMALRELSALYGPEPTAAHLVPIAIAMAQDPVPNIRFNVAKLLTIVVPAAAVPVVTASIKPCLLTLQQDVDGDVQYFATTALALCQ